ncbi:hypothetical protein GDO81_022403 [Engystomops pustulosus]|uniref:Uncharacterized protein n=1 Tax=Engystomops pustulosus TaxID=76066 RepID=A0AAV6ZDB4_ENGPU|nr:hypothetical protein GDO81_022403 [Engystomops pustulosus]
MKSASIHVTRAPGFLHPSLPLEVRRIHLLLPRICECMSCDTIQNVKSRALSESIGLSDGLPPDLHRVQVDAPKSDCVRQNPLLNVAQTETVRKYDKNALRGTLVNVPHDVHIMAHRRWTYSLSMNKLLVTVPLYVALHGP